jgi:hypothetical protein
VCHSCSGVHTMLYILLSLKYSAYFQHRDNYVNIYISSQFDSMHLFTIYSRQRHMIPLYELCSCHSHLVTVYLNSGKYTVFITVLSSVPVLSFCFILNMFCTKSQSESFVACWYTYLVVSSSCSRFPLGIPHKGISIHYTSNQHVNLLFPLNCSGKFAILV